MHVCFEVNDLVNPNYHLWPVTKLLAVLQANTLHAMLSPVYANK